MGKDIPPQSACGEFSRISQPGSAETAGALPTTPHAPAMANAGRQTHSRVLLVLIQAPCEADLARVPEAPDMPLMICLRSDDA
ncbi:hypothetical protein GCM10010207_22850 [Streptomyces atratus]|nr:hypothetical protein GCM10010207_22850 [Streptomyces atratus]